VLVGTILVAEAVKVPPVLVGRVIAAGSFGAIRGVMSREARDVNSGPLGPIV